MSTEDKLIETIEGAMHWAFSKPDNAKSIARALTEAGLVAEMRPTEAASRPKLIETIDRARRKWIMETGVWSKFNELVADEIIAAALIAETPKAWPEEDGYTADSFADLRTAIQRDLNADFPNYATWPIELPAGHWRAILKSLANPKGEAPKARAALNIACQAGAVGPLGEIAAERQRQIDDEGWTHAHDDTEHDAGALADAAACYAATQPIYTWRSDLGNDPVPLWPWDQWPKPGERRRDLIKAAALIVAEIERLDRVPPPPETGGR